MTLPAVLTSVLLLLGGCHSDSRQAVPTQVAADNLAPAPGSAPLSHGSAATPTPAPASEEGSTTAAMPISSMGAGTAAPASSSPDMVLRQWGTAIEQRNWAAVRALWGSHGDDSGLSRRQFAARWDVLRRPLVVIGMGSQEGAAGSLYYTAPVTITDRGRKIAGSLTIRRANDVPGATSEQLRWHADATTRAPWTTLR